MYFSHKTTYTLYDKQISTVQSSILREVDTFNVVKIPKPHPHTFTLVTSVELKLELHCFSRNGCVECLHSQYI